MTKAKYETSDLLDPYPTFTHADEIADCGEPGCEGNCDHCKEYEAYNKRMDIARKNCKVQQFMEDPITKEYGAQDCADLVYCTCPLCTKDIDPSSIENDEE